MIQLTQIIPIAIIFVGIIIFLIYSKNKKRLIEKNINQIFPELWRNLLSSKVLFYKNLSTEDKKLFEKRTQLFLATKIISGVDTEIDDSIRLMIASSAIIPTFAFPKYNYPNVNTILVYPHSFDKTFQTQRYEGHKENILGMVDGNHQNNTMILSKPDLVSAFDGSLHKENVGIHEFVHMLDKQDGEINGIPDILINQRFVGPWLHEIKNEMKLIEDEKSDINPYALTNNAEFMAVVSEYYFCNPDKFLKQHPHLYQYLSAIYNRN